MRTRSASFGTLSSVALAATLLSLAACSSSPSSSDEAGTTAVTAATTAPATTAAPSTTAPLEQRAMAYTQPGPYPVGVTTVDADGVPGGQQIEVWYPAAEGTSGTVSYDVRDFTPEALRKLLTADVPATVTIDGERDAAAADGTFPLVLFSHGYAGIRVQSSFLTSHLASWGIVVASPDHPSRDLAAVTTGQARNGNGTDDPSVADLQTTLTKMAEQNRIEGPLESHIDLQRVYAVGHSAGGATVLNAAAKMPEIKGYVSLASGGLTPPDKPSLFIAGANDRVVSLDDITRPTYEAAPSPSSMWVIDSAGHNAFDDFCSIGDGQGIIGIAEASGLGPFLDSRPQLRSLGADGCLPPNAPVAEAWPIIRHAVTAWIYEQAGLDPAAAGDLTPDVAGSYDVGVTITEK
jgi:dienelactone hydrolase